MDIEQETRVIPVDENFDAEVRKIAAEGWQLSPEVKPFMTYHLVRVRAGGDAVGLTPKLVIDDRKIFILRDGKLIQ